MKKIVSQIAGAVAVVSAATFAFAQTNDTSTTAADNSSVNAPSKDSRFGAGGNNGSVYTPAIRRNDIKAGNVNNESDEIVTKTVVAPAPAPVVTTTPEPAPIVAEPVVPAVVATPEPTPAPAVTEPAPMRAARADRN